MMRKELCMMVSNLKKTFALHGLYKKFCVVRFEFRVNTSKLRFIPFLFVKLLLFVICQIMHVFVSSASKGLEIMLVQMDIDNASNYCVLYKNI